MGCGSKILSQMTCSTFSQASIFEKPLRLRLTFRITRDTLHQQRLSGRRILFRSNPCVLRTALLLRFDEWRTAPLSAAADKTDYCAYDQCGSLSKMDHVPILLASITRSQCLSHFLRLYRLSTSSLTLTSELWRERETWVTVMKLVALYYCCSSRVQPAASGAIMIKCCGFLIWFKLCRW